MILNQTNDIRDNHPLTSNDMEKVLELQNSVLMRRTLPTFPYTDFYRPGIPNIFSDDTDTSSNVIEQQKLIQNLLKHYQNTLLDETQWLSSLSNPFPKRFDEEDARIEEGRKRKREEDGKVFTKQRKTNFTAKEVETLLNCVAERKDVILFGVAGGKGWAKAWQEIAKVVSKVEGIDRTEGDVRKKWTYLKWEAKNTSKPGRDPVSKQVLNILTSREREVADAMSMRESLDPFPPDEKGEPPGEPSMQMGQSPATPPTHHSKPPSPMLLQQQRLQQQMKKEPPQLLTTKPPVTKVPQRASAKAPPPTEVKLCWNSYHSNMKNTFPSLLNNEQFVDVTLACDGRQIKCHKIMLSACSPYLEELLSSNPCAHPIIFLKDMKFWELTTLVDFMYRGEVNVAQDQLPSLLNAAEALQIKGLASPVHPSGAPPTVRGTDSPDSISSFMNQFKSEMKTGNDDDSYMQQDTDDELPPCAPKIKKRKTSDVASTSGRATSTPNTSVNGKKHREKEAASFTSVTPKQHQQQQKQHDSSRKSSLPHTSTNMKTEPDHGNGYNKHEYSDQSIRTSNEDLSIDEEHAQYILQQYSQSNDNYAEEEDGDGSNASG